MTNQLSGGQQQRVALARALVMQPGVLLFDEPLSNLDAKLRVTMRTEIRKIQQKLGITAIYVTHDQSEAMSLSAENTIIKINDYNPRAHKIYKAGDKAYLNLENSKLHVLEVFLGAHRNHKPALHGSADATFKRRNFFPPFERSAPFRSGLKLSFLMR